MNCTENSHIGVINGVYGLINCKNLRFFMLTVSVICKNVVILQACKVVKCGYFTAK